MKPNQTLRNRLGTKVRHLKAGVHISKLAFGLIEDFMHRIEADSMGTVDVSHLIRASIEKNFYGSLVALSHNEVALAR